MRDKATDSASQVCTLSHTMDVRFAEQLRLLAFEQRVSESAILEYAFAQLLRTSSHDDIAQALRKAGYGLRRKPA